MESNTQRVWDYAEDGYVHRLVQNEADGKIVELPLHDESKKSNEEKIDKIGFEYSKLLITQLESQREYYENQLSEFKSSLVYEKSQVNKLEKMMEELKVTVSESVNEMSILREEQRRKNEEKASLKEQNNNLLKLNKAMVQKLKMYETNTELLKKENEELHEQVSDLMFFLESREKLKDSSDDVKEGKLFMVPKNSK
ncbi:RING finger protein ETP1 [Pichia kudriavzevii]|nr:RING finger protein ETP1 [Pichia kudriavzevii]UQE86016.1 RING finger protein [Pichia kudriavzevii]